MEGEIIKIIFYFFMYSLLGWAMESIYLSIGQRRLVNTGFLYGPFCPIYGFGAVVLYVLLIHLQGKPVLIFLAGFFVLSVWEYFVGFLLEKLFKTKYWDYSNNKFNFQGRICLLNSIYWGILGVVFIQFIHPFIESKILLIPEMPLQINVSIIMIIVLADAINTIVRVKNIRTTLEKIEKLNTQIKEKLQELKEQKFDDEKHIHLDLQEVVQNLEKKRRHIAYNLYKRVTRLKKAFPAIDSKEITEILNKKIEFKKKKKSK